MASFETGSQEFIRDFTLSQYCHCKHAPQESVIENGKFELILKNASAFHVQLFMSNMSFFSPMFPFDTIKFCNLCLASQAEWDISIL